MTLLRTVRGPSGAVVVGLAIAGCGQPGPSAQPSRDVMVHAADAAGGGVTSGTRSLRLMAPAPGPEVRGRSSGRPVVCSPRPDPDAPRPRASLRVVETAAAVRIAVLVAPPRATTDDPCRAWASAVHRTITLARPLGGRAILNAHGTARVAGRCDRPGEPRCLVPRWNASP
jgi:hypothetical protein